MSLPALSLLSCQVQTYDFGTVGPDSRVARYASAQPENHFEAKDDGTYAEVS
jgi:hypothetical protein